MCCVSGRGHVGLVTPRSSWLQGGVLEPLPWWLPWMEVTAAHSSAPGAPAPPGCAQHTLASLSSHFSPVLILPGPWLLGKEGNGLFQALACLMEASPVRPGLLMRLGFVPLRSPCNTDCRGTFAEATAATFLWHPLMLLSCSSLLPCLQTHHHRVSPQPYPHPETLSA